METVKDLCEAYIATLKPKASRAKANLVLDEIGEMPLKKLLGSIKEKYGDNVFFQEAYTYKHNGFRIETEGREIGIRFAGDEVIHHTTYKMKEWIHMLCFMIAKVTRGGDNESLQNEGTNILTYAQEVVRRKNAESENLFNEEYSRLKKETEDIYADEIEVKKYHEDVLSTINKRKYKFDQNIDEGMVMVREAMNEVYREVGYILAHKSLCDGMWGKTNKKLVEWCDFLCNQTWAIAKLAKSAKEKNEMDRKLGITNEVVRDNIDDKEGSTGISVTRHIKEEEPFI